MKLELEFDPPKRTEEERSAYVAQIAGIFRHLERDIKEEMQEQLVQGFTQGQKWDDVLKYQGILEGMAILLEKWRTVNAEYEERAQPEEEPDNTNTIGDIS